MLKRILLSILVGIATGIVVYIIGALLSVLPVVAGLGAIIKGLSVICGVVGAIIFFITGRTIWE